MVKHLRLVHQYLGRSGVQVSALAQRKPLVDRRAHQRVRDADVGTGGAGPGHEKASGGQHVNGGQRIRQLRDLGGDR